jgi:hypothetical protein
MIGGFGNRRSDVATFCKALPVLSAGAFAIKSCKNAPATFIMFAHT